jgi:hypothetical protein
LAADAAAKLAADAAAAKLAADTAAAKLVADAKAKADADAKLKAGPPKMKITISGPAIIIDTGP